MEPFRFHRQAVPAEPHHCPFGGCAVCASQPTLVLREFAALICRSWSTAELEILRKAAGSALL
jgi:hypothetical protein